MKGKKDLFVELKHRLRVMIDRIIEQKWFNVGLRTKMGVMVTVGLVGLLTIFILLGISTARQATQQVLSERVMLARLTATTFDSSFRHVESMLSLLADQPVLRDPQASPAQRQEALREPGLFRLGVYLVDANARLLAFTGGDYAGLSWADIPAVRSALNGKDFNLLVLPGESPTILNTNGLLGGHPLALIAIPVRDSAGEPVGSLVTLLDLTDTGLFPLEGTFNLGSTGTLDVVDPRGLVLISTRSERILQASDQDNILSKLFVAGQPGVETCLGCYGNEPSETSDEVVAFAPLTQAPWGVVVRQKAAEVFAPVRRLTTVTLGLELATVLGALVLVWVTTNSVIKPVQQLTKASQRIADGDLDTPVYPLDNQPDGNPPPGRRSRRTDEIGALADSFVMMRRQLKSSMDEIQALNRDLDRRVHERTQAAYEAQVEAQAARDDLRAVIDALSDTLVVIGVEDFRIQQMNQTAAERASMQGVAEHLPCYDLFNCGMPGVSQECDCPIPAVLKTGKSVRVTHLHSCPDQDSPCYEDIVASPMRDASGKITRIVELSRDISEEKRTKESLVRRNQQLSIVNAVAITVNQSLDLRDILGRALDEVLNLTEIDAGAVFLQEEALGNLNLMAYRGLSEEAARLASQLGMLDNSCGGVREKGQIIIIPDLSRYRGRRARSLQREHLSTLVHVPLVAKGSTLGSMCVGTRKKRQFSPEEQELLTALGSQIAVAIENARLYAEVQQKEHVRGELFKKVINAQEEERKRIARELHDETSQSLTALIFAAEEGLEMDNLDEVKRGLEGMRDLAQHTLDGVHKLIFDLRPSMLDHLGLVPALRWFADFRLEPKGIRVSIEEVASPRRLPAEVETALFRTVQEAINNIARHSAARNVNIIFCMDEEKAEVVVEDDGIGFDLDEINRKVYTPRGLGLLGMRERLELLGGNLEVRTSPGSGTRLRIRVPAVQPMDREVIHA
jgi:signal transduction histidine kinase/HAMP domain-containing protein